jgi:hypothetical protein
MTQFHQQAFSFHLAGTTGSSGVPQFQQARLQPYPGELPQSTDVQES